MLDASVPLAWCFEDESLARAQHLTLYDAAYLELAIRLGVPLASLDEPLLLAARAEGVQRFQAR